MIVDYVKRKCTSMIIVGFGESTRFQQSFIDAFEWIQLWFTTTFWLINVHNLYFSDKSIGFGPKCGIRLYILSTTYHQISTVIIISKMNESVY